MEKIAFVMQLKKGCEDEYEIRHDHIWPELKAELKLAGISDYSIFLHPDTLQLFGVLKRRRAHGMDRLPQRAVMRKWWDHMADLMETEPDNSPVSLPLIRVFHMD